MRLQALSITLLMLLICGNALAQKQFIAFESGPVRPVVISPDGSRLFVANIPDGYLEIYDLSEPDEPRYLASIPVGLEPVALAAISDDVVWVVNHLSDSVSIVSVSAQRVIQTLLVGDEPRDIVVARPEIEGVETPRVFISTAHRGQHRTDPSIAGVPGAGDPQTTTPGVGRNDVWVFDAASPGDAFGGTPIAILTFFSDTPRALAVRPDQSHVYVAAFFSGNQTTIVSEGLVCDGFQQNTKCSGDGIISPGGLSGGRLPGGVLGPDDNHEGVEAPEVGIIVKWNPVDNEYQDEVGRNWNNGVRFNLPDKDVFSIDTITLEETAFHSGVGTTLFNMVVDPVSNKLYVSNTESENLVRFEGPGNHGGTTVQGDLARSRITIIESPDSPGSSVIPRLLNKHIDYSILAGSPDFDTTAAAKSVSLPGAMVIHHDAENSVSTLYLAAFGSGAVAVFDPSKIEDNTFVPDHANHIGLTAGGPGGLALSSDGSRLYVLTRFDNGISVIDTALRQEISHQELNNPEPPAVVDGRPFLYDALATSSNGEASCASCHVFGDMDHLAWDLGDPDEDVKANPLLINFEALFQFFPSIGIDPDLINGGAAPDEFHPMKGAMTTQSLRGLANAGAMHWRGDRSNGFFGISESNAAISFNNFIVAFSGLLGRATNLGVINMVQFTDFALELTYPPNPHRALDNSLTVDQQAARDFFFGPRRSDGLESENDLTGIPLGFTCDGCHELNPALGRFGTSTDATFENESQIFKISHLRNMYQKVGMFGMPHTPFEISGLDHTFQGDQIRGFGFLHDGSTDTLARFFSATVFNGNVGNASTGTGFVSPNQRLEMEQFMLAFDSDLAPIVGAQITVGPTADDDALDRLSLLIERAAAPFTSKILGGLMTECDLVAKSTSGGKVKSWLYVSGAPGSAIFLEDDGLTTGEGMPPVPTPAMPIESI